MANPKPPTLGKNINAILGRDPKAALTRDTQALTSTSGLELPILQLCPGEYQPRGTILEKDLIDLADSIRAQGILQPILVRKKSPNEYEIIAGERRWRAAQLAGLKQVPVIVKEVPNENVMAMALIENIQRENLNALEEAYALERLSKEFQLTHQQVAEAVGKSRTTVTNLIRLLSLPDSIKHLLSTRAIEAGHAKVLLGLNLSAQLKVAALIVEKGLSVRECERLALSLGERREGARSAKSIDPDVQRLQRDLSDKLGAFVEILQGNQGKGKIQIRYNSLEELEGILSHIQ